MSDTSVNVERNIKADESVNGSGSYGPERLFAVPDMLRGFAEQGAVRTRENCEKMKLASAEVAGALRDAVSTQARGAADYSAKVIEISGENANAAFDFLAGLASTKSLSEALSLSAAQGRKNIERASAQNRQLWELAQKVATETAEPIRKGFARGLTTGA